MAALGLHLCMNLWHQPLVKKKVQKNQATARLGHGSINICVCDDTLFLDSSQIKCMQEKFM